MWLKWLPWRFLVSRVAKSGGFIDPVSILSRVHQFAQPSEVAEPIELLRAGVIFHARGLINARAIQHNLDWVWPYWVEQQFNPHSSSFVPRSFSVTHVNLTHRNWTAVGLPDCDWLPLVDPRGLVTPLFDGWSLDAWIIPDEGDPLFPSKSDNAEQRLLLEKDGLSIHTTCSKEGLQLEQKVQVSWQQGRPCCVMRLTARSKSKGRLAVSVRPVNPEGVSFINHIDLHGDPQSLRINKSASLDFSEKPEGLLMSHYRRGDVLQEVLAGHREGGKGKFTESVECDIGMATAAALFPLQSGQEYELTVRVPMFEAARPEPFSPKTPPAPREKPTSWTDALEGVCRLQVPDEQMQFLYDAAVRNMVLHAPGEVYPGPFTYRRFWYRDAAIILDAMLAVGMFTRVRQALLHFPERQTGLGYYRSQDGEWDSNGAALWALNRYRQVTGREFPESLIKSALKGAKWIWRKRVSDTAGKPHAGLMPAGFSAEHLGPNDYYYWDDFWSAAGLNGAAEILSAAGHSKDAYRCRAEADSLLAAVSRSLEQTSAQRDRPGVPASPYRRMDAGAVGSVVAGYPLYLWDVHDERLLDTVEFLLENCMVHGGFFQDMTHSGINAYLTLHLAQTLLRAGDSRYWDLIEAVAEFASPAGQWPEAVHPGTRGGCMGDGQHIWAAAEWVLMLRNCFVRTEGQRLILASGLPSKWLSSGKAMKLGPAPTEFGTITIEVIPSDDEFTVRWAATWRRKPESLEVRIGEHSSETSGDELGDDGSVKISMREAVGAGV